MTAKDLKNAILQLAIQGKLVPQNNSDEPASELLKRIHSEKDRLLQEGKIKREKTLPPISEEEIPFEIPSTWAWVKFGYIGCFSSGYTPKPHQLAKNGDIPYFKISDMNTCGNETYLQNAVQFLCDENPRYYLVGSIVYPKNGGAVYTNKRRILVKNSVVDLNTGVYTPYDQNTIPYLYLIFSFLDFKKYSIASPLPTLDINAIKNILIPLPPLEEQKRIVAKIEELMPLVEEYGNAEKELSALNAEFPEQLRKSILQLAVQGKLVPQNKADEPASELLKRIRTGKERLIKEGTIKREKPLPSILEDEIPFEIPSTWQWVRLNDIVSALGDGIHGTPNYCLDGEYYFINGNNLCDGEIVFKADTLRVNKEEYVKYKKPLNQNTILLSINGTIGNIAFYKNEPVILGKSACYVTLLDEVNKYYINVLLQTQMFYDYAVRKATQTTIKNVSLKAMRMLPVPLPPIEEQARIVARVEELLAVCDRLQ